MQQSAQIGIPTLDEVQRCGRRIADSIERTPLVSLGTHLMKLGEPVRIRRHDSCDSSDISRARGSASGEIEVFLKLENKQKCGSFKSRAAASYLSAIAERDGGQELLRHGVVTCSTGSFGQCLAWQAKRMGVRCAVAIPDFTDAFRRRLIVAAGADDVVELPFHEWWQCLERMRLCDDTIARHPELAAMHFVSQLTPECIAGDATVADEILAESADAGRRVDAIVLPYGLGSFACGAGLVVRRRSPATRVIAVEIATSAPLRNAVMAGAPRRCTHTPSFVDQLGGQIALPSVWDQVNRDNGLVSDSAVVDLEQVAEAIRLLKRNHDIVAEGAGAAALAAVLSGQAGRGRVVCVVTGGNVEQDMLTSIMTGGVPPPGLPIPPLGTSFPIWEPPSDGGSSTREKKADTKAVGVAQ